MSGLDIQSPLVTSYLGTCEIFLWVLHSVYSVGIGPIYIVKVTGDLWPDLIWPRWQFALNPLWRWDGHMNQIWLQSDYWQWKELGTQPHISQIYIRFIKNNTSKFYIRRIVGIGMIAVNWNIFHNLLLFGTLCWW